MDNERKNRVDDTLNTPGPKKPPTMQKPLNTSLATSSASKPSSTPVRTHAVKLGTSPSTLTNVIKTSTAPVLLNSKNVLPKTSAPMTNASIKLTPKLVTSSGAGGSSGTTTNITSMAGKTAVRTTNGQIIYIQKSPATSNIKTATTTGLVKTQSIAATGNKPVTIQVLRTADGNYVPIKTSSAGANGKNTTLTLSPSSMTGRKIISSTGGQVIIKGAIKAGDLMAPSSMAKTITTNALTGVRTVVKPLTTTTSSSAGTTNDFNKSKPIVVQATGGKQIIVPNQNIVKLSPKPTAATTVSGGGTTTTSTTSSSGQVHTIQIQGKSGVQYVRVLPNSKVATKTLNTSTPGTLTTNSSATTNTNQAVKILNSQKFKLVQEGGTTKLVVTQKKDDSSNANTTENSKMQKTIVTVPTIKSIYDDKNKPQQQTSLIKPSTSNINQNLQRKHKISEINSEIQRITNSTTTTTAATTSSTLDNAGPPEIKKPVPNNRVVVVSSSNNQPKILNNSIQQPGRITSTTLSIPSATNQTNARSNSSGGMVQVSHQVQVTQNGNKLYTVLKPSTGEQKSLQKPGSVLKSNNPPTLTNSSMTKPIAKPLINKQQLLQQQQKLLQLKQQEQYTTKSLQTSATATTTAGATKTSYVLPFKIKEEPVDSNSSHVDATTLPPSSAQVVAGVEEEVDPMVGGVRRKHCNCSKSQCLKLYCDCFANGEFCQDCTCKDCFNNLENEDERQRAIKMCLERNPNAFK